MAKHILPPTSPHPKPQGLARSQAVGRASLTAMVINALLSLIQIVVGLMANAFSLVADAMHTLADLTTDALIAWASRRAGAPPDANHPYGHGRLETLASLALGLVLTGVGIGFVWAAALRLQQSDALPPITLPALIVALTVLAVKEGLYHWLKAQSKALAAPVLEAAAWHARSDAASSLVVAVGIGASLAGYPVLEPLAAAIVGFLILSMGIRFAYRAVSELIDTGLPAEQVSALEAAILATPGALAVHELRTRQMGHQWLVDAHVQVAPRVSVSEGHRIADQVMHQLKTRFPQIAQVTIHIDHELDIKPAAPVNPPVVDRDALLSEIRQRLGYPTFPSEWLQIHYLDGRCEIDLMLPSHLPAPLAKLATDNAARQQLTHEMQTAHPCLVAVRWWQELAP